MINTRAVILFAYSRGLVSYAGLCRALWLCRKNEARAAEAATLRAS